MHPSVNAEFHPLRARPFISLNPPPPPPPFMFSAIHRTLLTGILIMMMVVCICFVSECERDWVLKYVCSTTVDRWSNTKLAWNSCWTLNFPLDLKMALLRSPRVPWPFTFYLGNIDFVLFPGVVLLTFVLKIINHDFNWNMWILKQLQMEWITLSWTHLSNKTVGLNVLSKK